ncbi:ABC transporter permease [Salinibacterium sp.]|uniref:ABC transporter permease n=1 Tax=Salinibacterium sp. TaxID=1915057 RepID=UPI00286A83F9|nr:ABC transporter permease [Salinibacterium sp.]
MSETLTVPEKQRNLVSRFASRDAILVGILIVILLSASLALPRFASPVTVGYLLLNAVPLLLIALPMTLIIITGEIDLSVASIVGLSTATIGSLTLQGWEFGPAVLMALVVGVIAGAVNGALIAFVGLPSLAVTIGTLALYRGLALVFIGDNSVSSSQHPAEFAAFVNLKLGATGIPVVILIVALFIGIFAVVLHVTPFGRGLYALGYSREAATFVGITVGWSKFWLYIASGLTCGVVGVFWSLYYSARSDSATGLELTVIAAVLLGGISIFGGRGTIVGAIAGVLVISSINYALRLQRVPDVVLIIITGSLLIISVIGPSVFAALRQRQYSKRVRRRIPRD